MSETGRAQGGALTGYMAAQFAFFTGSSMMGLLMPWIYTQYLRLPADQVGLAFTISQVPMALILFGGAAADGRALSRYLAYLQLALAVPAAVLLAASAAGVLSFPVAVVCAFCASAVASYIMPARDALLAHAVTPGRALTQAVAAATSAMFAGQMLGFGLGSLASATGLSFLLFVHIAVLALAAVITAKLRLSPEHPGPKARRSAADTARDIREGLRGAWSDTRIRTVTLIVACSSVAMNSAFVVGLPLLVRDHYHGTSVGVAALFVAFMLGTTLTSAYLSRRKPVEAQGRVFMSLFLNSALMFLGVHSAPPFWGAVLLIFGWGLGAGAGMVLSRSIIQAAAPPALRARILSVFQLAQMIGSIVGPVILGALAHRFGILDALLAVVFWVLLLWALFSVLTPIWSFRRQEDPGDTAPTLPASTPQEYLRSDHQGKKAGIPDETLPGN